MMRLNRGVNIAAPSNGVNPGWWLALAAVGALKLLLVRGVELGKDEAAYWFWSQHLDASYALVPFSFMAIAHRLWPGAEWALRLPAILLSLGGTVLLYALCRQRALTRSEALWAAAAFATCHWTWHTSSYLHPDGYLVPLWLLALWLAHRALATSAWSAWVAVGAAVGLVCLTKYSGAALAGGLLVSLGLASGTSGRRLPLVAAATCAVVVLPLAWAQWQTGLSLPATLSTLSRVAADRALPVRLAYFAAGPLLYVSPLLLWLLYDALLTGVARTARHRRAGDLVDVLPGLLLLGVFAFFALGRGQVKGNWLLPAFLGVWPLAFSATGRAGGRLRRPLLAALVALGAVQSAAIGLALQHPSLLLRLQPLTGAEANATYPALVSAADRPREPALTWSARLCEYHGWGAFAGAFEAAATRAGVSPTVPVVSGQYAIPFGLAYYGSPQRPVHTVEDPRFSFLADLAPARTPPQIIYVGLAPARPPPWLGRVYGPPSLMPGLERQGPECEAERYELLWFQR